MASPLVRRLLGEKLALRGSYKRGCFQRMVAARYVQAPDYDPATVPLFRLFAEKVAKQAQQLRHTYQPKYSTDDPYPSMKAMSQDVRRQHAQSRVAQVNTYSAPPQGIEKMPYTADQNALFRFVHDVVAHLYGQHPFSSRGEFGAFNRHIKTLGPRVAPILFVEIIGQTACHAIYGTFVGQKAVFLPDFDPLNVGALSRNSPLNRWFVLQDKVLQPVSNFAWKAFSQFDPALAKVLSQQPGFDPLQWENYTVTSDTSAQPLRYKKRAPAKV